MIETETQSIRSPQLMVRCAACKWWGRKCGDVQTHCYCENPKCQSENTDGFGSQDGEPYNGGTFASGPDFGCVHGEMRSTPNVRDQLPRI